MVRRRFTRGFLCLCLILAGPVPWSFAAAAAAADTNGDSNVDILDLQKAVAALLAPGADARLSDVNGDGVVDILDVQRILNEASETSAPEEPAPLKPGAPPAVPPASTNISVLLPVALQQAVLTLEPVEPAARPTLAEERSSPPPSTFRLVFGLSPHAPPCGPARQPHSGKL